MAEAGLQWVESYVSRRQNTVAHFIATRPITDLCLAAERRPESRVTNRWWEQDGLDVKGVQMADREAERTDGEGGDGRDGDEDRLSQWEDNVARVTLGTEPNYLLAYDLGLKHRHLIISTLGEPRGWLERERDMNGIVLSNMGNHVSAVIPLTRFAIFQVLISALFYDPQMEWGEQEKRGVTQHVFGQCTKGCVKM